MGTSAPRILLVDDLEANRFLLEEALGDLGAEILSAEDGRRALRIAAASHPEVVVLDFQMPDLNGAVTARALKQAGLPFTYIILTSGYPEAGDGEAIDTASVDRFLGKPYTLENLRASVVEGLRVSRERRAAVTSGTART